jgi:hypothetical protein
MSVTAHCVYSGPLPPEAEREIVFSANDVPNLTDRVRGALAAWSRTTKSRPKTSNVRFDTLAACLPVKLAQPLSDNFSTRRNWLSFFRFEE